MIVWSNHDGDDSVVNGGWWKFAEGEHLSGSRFAHRLRRGGWNGRCAGVVRSGRTWNSGGRRKVATIAPGWPWRGVSRQWGFRLRRVSSVGEDLRLLITVLTGVVVKCVLFDDATAFDILKMWISTWSTAFTAKVLLWRSAVTLRHLNVTRFDIVVVVVVVVVVIVFYVVPIWSRFAFSSNAIAAILNWVDTTALFRQQVRRPQKPGDLAQVLRRHLLCRFRATWK